jgi:hypothetical protein
MMCQSRFRLIGLLVIGMSFLAKPASAQSKPPISEEIAKAYGLDSWGQIEQIRYTFNIDLPAFKLARTWTWEPKSGRVTYEGKDKAGKPLKITYMRPELASQDETVKNEIEPGFVNDMYWLTFPFHQFQDSGAKVEDAGIQKLPLGKGTAEKVVVSYASELGGYTPGDTWTLFVGTDKRVQEFIYKRGGDKKPQLLTAAWTDYKKVGPFLLSLDHRGIADGKPARIFFSDVSVKLAGKSAWVGAQ